MTKTGKRTPVKPIIPTRPYVTHGGRRIPLPLLTGAVGPDQAEARKLFPVYNQAADVQIVEHYFGTLAEVSHLIGTCGPLLDPKTVRAAQAAQCWDASLPNAIQRFQTQLKVGDATETRWGLIRPDGPTLKSLVDYGDYAEQLKALRERDTTHTIIDSKSADYIYYGPFRMDKFKQGVTTSFEDDDNYDAAKLPQLEQLLHFMENDKELIDLRWMAYILATVTVETTRPDKKGQIHGPDRFAGAWNMQWAPVEEVGKGEKSTYGKAVKVKDIGTGEARVTTQAGQQFQVKANGSYSALKTDAKKTPAQIYGDDDGTEHTYYGRGYVQLTWWYNYAGTGAVIGKGLDLLFHPEHALDPQTSYDLMSYCLRTGKGFVNGHKLGDYICGPLVNYAGARAMVNAHDRRVVNEKIVGYAVMFERILKVSRV